MPVSPLTHRPFADRTARSAEPVKQGKHAALYNSWRWRKASKAFLKRNPLCAKCEKIDHVAAANVVDHVIPHRGDLKLFWDQGNWQSLCRSHHSSDKQAEERAKGA